MMLCERIGKNENIIKINNNANVSHIGKNIIHKMLESGRSIGEAKRHDQVFKSTVAGPEGGKPLVAISNSDVIVTSSEINLGEDFGGLQLVEKVANEWKQVSILPS